MLSQTLSRGIVCALVVAAGVVGALAVLFPSSSLLGEPVRRGLRLLAGEVALLLPLWLIAGGGLGLLKLFRPEGGLPWGRVWGAAVVTLTLMGMWHMLSGGPEPRKRAMEGFGGGLLGYGLSSGLVVLLGSRATKLVVVGLLAFGLLLTLHLS
ncbi:MAG: hypothetical protein IT307_14320, partial [Chloroflexi bacterium]|nr:hypothetical protein [Chloroflexota bacterium]